jgi:hypothetical protein
VEVEKRRAAKRIRAVVFAVHVRQLERQKTGWSDMSTKIDGNQHIGGTHGKSQGWRAWHWRLTDSQPILLRLLAEERVRVRPFFSVALGLAYSMP